MDILKNICLSFNFIIKNKYFDKNVFFISFFIKCILLYFFLNIDLFFIMVFLKNSIKNNINKKNRKFLFFLNNIFFLNILISNLFDLIPVNIIKNLFKKNINITLTSNINYTFFMSLIFFIVIIFISIKKNNILNFFIFFLKNPIKNKYMFFFNFLIEFISFVMKPISLSLRLFGNIFSSEIIFNLISNTNLLLNVFLNFIWSIFHLIVLPLQSFIFITLVTIYISQSLKH